jgi:hypothetical protein
MGRSEHTFGENDLWCTPPQLFEPVLEALELDAFGLDPFGNPLSIVPARAIVMLPIYRDRPVFELLLEIHEDNARRRGKKMPTGDALKALEDEIAVRKEAHLEMIARCNSTVYWCDSYVGGNGFNGDWSDRGAVFCNGPTSDCEPWAEKMAGETGGDENVSLWPARTGASYFQQFIFPSDVVQFWKGRLKFLGAPDPAPWASVVSYVGPRGDQFWRRMKKFGACVVNRRLWR